jgi:hypothetical protein
VYPKLIPIKAAAESPVVKESDFLEGKHQKSPGPSCLFLPGMSCEVADNRYFDIKVFHPADFLYRLLLVTAPK